MFLSVGQYKDVFLFLDGGMNKLCVPFKIFIISHKLTYRDISRKYFKRERPHIYIILSISTIST